MNRYFEGLVGASAYSPPDVRPRLSHGFAAREANGIIADAAPEDIESVVDAGPIDVQALRRARRAAPASDRPATNAVTEPARTNARPGDVSADQRLGRSSSGSADSRLTERSDSSEGSGSLAASSGVPSATARSMPSSRPGNDHERPLGGTFRTATSEPPAEPATMTAKFTLAVPRAERVVPSPRATADAVPELRRYSTAGETATSSEPQQRAGSVAMDREIHISIGRVIVTGQAPKQKPAAPRTAARSQLDLGHYLDRRRRES